MFIPPRIRTQFPTQDNVSSDDVVPVPIESAFFLEDGQQDPTRVNRYYFDFPGNWATSNNGETIIGIRNISMIKRIRKIQFSLVMAKYKKESYNKFQKEHQTFTHDEIIDALFTPNNIINALLSGTNIYKDGEKHEVNVLIYLLENEGFNEFYEKLNGLLNSYFNGLSIFSIVSIVNQSLNNPSERDLVMEGYYKNNSFHQKIYSPRNNNDSSAYKVSFKIRIKGQNDDFKELFNIGEGPLENNPYNYSAEWKDELDFHNLWDRKTCKIYSSIAEQSNHGYIGSSEITYNPIKYFKLKATDHRFWVEFYSSIYENVPARIPKTESFCIEMQFLPFDKNLRI